ncbi:MAG: CPBP family intramembrane glutamic endopeptidase [Clostridiaceae bacterium]|nr:CPBP family intramembrane glutamic endopeptidase [Clostridiaceae bacterium]
MYFVIAIITLFLVLLFNLFCSAPLQTAFGVWGVAATEIGYGLIALLGASAMVIGARRTKTDGVDCVEIFSTRIPRPKAVCGGILLIGASYFASALFTNILYILFPAMVDQTVESMKNTFYAANLPTMLVAMALFPAICEELVFRGVMQYAIDRHGTPRIAILMTGVVFGLFHLDPVRIPIAAMTGIVLCYALYRSRSIFVPMLMHFINNAASALISAIAPATSEDAVTASEEMLAQYGLPGNFLYLIAGIELTVMVLGLLIGGLALLEPNPTEALKKHKATAIVLGCIVMLLGAGYCVLSMVTV